MASDQWHTNRYNYHGPPIPPGTSVHVACEGKMLPATVVDVGFSLPFRNEFRYIVCGRFYPDPTFLPYDSVWTYIMCATRVGYNESELRRIGEKENQEEEVYYGDNPKALRERNKSFGLENA